MASIYDFEVQTLGGETVSLADYRGKALLIVNTASKCGFTPQYAGLEELHQNFADKGLVVLGFPCNQFGKQEPGTHEEIAGFCQRNYGVSFPMHAKIDVNGPQEHPLYTFLKAEQGGVLGAKIKWNFTKFLVNRRGQVVERFGSVTKPTSAKLVSAIEAALAG